MVVMGICLAGCANNSWEEVPSTAYDFCMKYWPEYAIESYSNSDGVQTVVIKGAATVYFNQSSQWIRIDGNGGTMPTMLLWDQLPSALYTYVEQVDALEAVYGMARSSSAYEVTLSDQTISYDVSTGEITGSSVSS